jgi:hypothetical protein
MFSLKLLALVGAIVGATAFAPVSMSTSELHFAAPRICTRGSAVVRSMSGDGTTTLTRPSGGTQTLLREKLEHSVWIREKEWKSGGQVPDAGSQPPLAEPPAAPTVSTLDTATSTGGGAPRRALRRAARSPATLEATQGQISSQFPTDATSARTHLNGT